MPKHITDYAFYRWRYILGYLFVGILVALVVTTASVYVPGALREGEIAASLKSGALSVESIEPQMVIDLPYHILQRFSFILFGISTLSIKLPSIILGLLTILGVFLLTRTWFRRNVAVLTTIIAVTSTHFLFLLQDGTPNIMFSFLTVWLLFAATYVTRKKTFGTFWKVLTGVLMATALYTPLGVYLIVAVLTTTFFHPHIRHVIRRFSRPRLWIGVALGVVSALPLIYASVVNYTVPFALLGIPTGNLDVKHNLITLFFDLFGFASISTNYLLRPVYSLGLVLLIAIGLYKLLTYKYTARSYITLSLGLILIPLIILNPERVTHLFPLACLMIALGLATLITNWYKLFPRNPYARVAGLIPLSILVLGVIVSGVLRYINSYIYSPEVLAHYSNDLRLVQRNIGLYAKAKHPVVLVTSSQQLPFYAMVAHHDKRFSATSQLPATVAPNTTLIVTNAAFHKTKFTHTPTLIITNRFATNADRLYIYK